MELRVNDRVVDVDAEPNTPLLWVLRDHLGLTGTKYGCGIGQCGACTVHLDQGGARSCLMPVELVAGKAITTIEGLEPEHPVIRAWIEEDVPQCGYCQPGMIMAVSAFLRDHPDPSDRQVELSITNICRCGTYDRIRTAIRRAAQMLRTG